MCVFILRSVHMHIYVPHFFHCGPGSSDTPVPVSTPSAHFLVSEYHFPVKGGSSEEWLILWLQHGLHRMSLEQPVVPGVRTWKKQNDGPCQGNIGAKWKIG